MLMEDPCGPHRSIADIARERGVDPVEALIQVALERDLKAFFVQPLFNENFDHVLEMMKHPRSVVTFSDSGATSRRSWTRRCRRRCWPTGCAGARRSPSRRACGC